MSFIYIMIIVFLVIGFGFIIFSIFHKGNAPSSNFFEVEAVIQLINSSIEEADNAIENLNNLSSDVFKEFDEKYQELIFLYQILEDKKSDIKADGGVSTTSHKNNAAHSKNSESKNKNKITAYNNPRLPEIKELRKKGFSISEIAKELDIGQGEVKLIVELGNL